MNWLPPRTIARPRDPRADFARRFVVRTRKIAAVFALSSCGLLLLPASNAQSSTPTAAPGEAKPQGWGDDLQAACARAGEAKKDVLVLFAGTGWSAPCAAMQREVFTQPRFLSAVSTKFELVRFDTPEDLQSMAADAVAQHASRIARFDVKSFPTLVLVDAQGTPYARSRRYRAEGPDAFLERLSTLQERKTLRDEAFAEADRLRERLQDGAREGSSLTIPGVSNRRVEVLQSALRRLHAEVPMRDYVPRIQELLEAMAGTARGATRDTKFWQNALKGILVAHAVQQIEQRAAVLLRNRAFDDLDQTMRTMAQDASPAVQQRAMFFRMIGAARHHEDYDAALNLAEQAIALDPASEFVDVLRSYAAQLRSVARGVAQGSKGR